MMNLRSAGWSGGFSCLCNACAASSAMPRRQFLCTGTAGAVAAAVMALRPVLRALLERLGDEARDPRLCRRKDEERPGLGTPGAEEPVRPHPGRERPIRGKSIGSEQPAPQRAMSAAHAPFRRNALACCPTAPLHQ